MLGFIYGQPSCLDIRVDIRRMGFQDIKKLTADDVFGEDHSKHGKGDPNMRKMGSRRGTFGRSFEKIWRSDVQARFRYDFPKVWMCDKTKGGT